jgi:hypothetical protein
MNTHTLQTIKAVLTDELAEHDSWQEWGQETPSDAKRRRAVEQALAVVNDALNKEIPF